MYHLPYFEKFYHAVHIPIHYVLMVGYDDPRGGIWVQDNSRPDIQWIPFEDLQCAWNVCQPGVNRRNTAYVLEFSDHAAAPVEIMRKGFAYRARNALNPVMSSLGIPGIRKLSADFSRWSEELSDSQRTASLQHLVIFTASVVPLLPQCLLPYPLETADPHQAMRDRLARDLHAWGDLFHIPQYNLAAQRFAASGKLIGELTDSVAAHLLNSTAPLEHVPQLLSSIADEEEAAFGYLLDR